MSSTSALSKANIDFCLDLLKKLSDGDKTANVFISPFSISSALAMVMQGAKGNTQTQISETLRAQDCKDFPAEYAKLLDLINAPKAPYSLSVANKLYGEQTYEFDKKFSKENSLESVDFKGSHEEVRKEINKWVETQTQGKIKDLLAQGTVGNLIKLVLVNAIYFKAKWLKTFLEKDTKDAEFHINKTETKPVKMMHLKKTLSYTDDVASQLQILELPYEGRELSMFIFLPMESAEDFTLEKLENTLTYDYIMEWTGLMSSYDMTVELPRFTMEEKYDMKDVLVSMGMVDAFDLSLSDFSGMSPKGELALSKVVHKAFVDVNEEGTEAAAATGAAMTLGCAMRPRRDFNANRPFLFFIQHKTSKSILFAGRCCSP